MTKYVSEFDQWLRNYKKQNPDTESKQREGRALLWDKRPEQIDQPKKAINNQQQGYAYYPVRDYTNK